MEIKKSKAADLEGRKTTGFLLGLIVALSLCFGALEFTTRQETGSGLDEVMDAFDEDMEKIPVLEQKDMVAVMENPSSAPSVSEKLREVPEVALGKDVDKLNLDTKGGEESALNAEPVPEKVEHKSVALPPVVLDDNDNPLNWRVVEELPEFPGGMVEFMKWLSKSLRYPPIARTRKIQGQVVVQFVINKNGTISDTKVIKSVDPSLDREALRVIGMMPNWKPGKMGGETCRTLFAVPIVFKL